MRRAQASRSVVPFPAAASPDVTRREGQGPQGSARRPRPLFGTALPTCMLCVPNSRLMAQNPPPRLGSPARTASPRHRRLCRRAAVWTTWTSWGRPSCSSPCPRSPNKCGGEGTAWLGWGGSVPRPQQHPLPGSPRPRSQRPGARVLPWAAVANGPPRAKHCTGLEGGSGARGRCRAHPVEHRAASHRAGAGTGLWPLLCPRSLGPRRFTPPMPRPPTREKQQPAPRLTLRDLQNKSNCSSTSSSAAGLLHAASPEPPGPPQQPTTTELSLANVTVPLESIKPSEWAGGASGSRLGRVSTPPSSTPPPTPVVPMGARAAA